MLLMAGFHLGLSLIKKTLELNEVKIKESLFVCTALYC